jgi:hypothetical protein
MGGLSFDDFKDRHPSTTNILRYFTWSHLPRRLQLISEPAGLLALNMVDQLPDGPELTAGLRKLLEAKDCFVRSRLDLPIDDE